MAGFARDTAEKTHQSIRTIERKTRIGEVLRPHFPKLKDTKIADSLVDLEVLAKERDEEARTLAIENIVTGKATRSNVALGLAWEEIARTSEGDSKMPSRKKMTLDKQKIFELRENFKLIQGDFDQIPRAMLTRDSATLVLHDAFDSLPFSVRSLEELSSFSSAILKPGGSMMILTSQEDMPRVFKNLPYADLQYSWTLASFVPHEPKRSNLIIDSSWLPVLWLRKDEYNEDDNEEKPRDSPMLSDLLRPVIESSISIPSVVLGSTDRRARFETAWELIGRFSKPNDIVACPLLMSAEFAIAAAALGRRFVGAIPSPEVFGQIRDSISNLGTEAWQNGLPSSEPVSPDKAGEIAVEAETTTHD